MNSTDLKKLLDFNPNRGGGDVWFKPQPGPGGKEEVYRVRLLPPYDPDSGVPFHSEVLHYLGSYGDKNAPRGVCPAAHQEGVKCPACDVFWTTRTLVDRDNKDIYQALRNIGPSRRLYCNVLDRRDDKVRVWSLPVGGDQSAGVRLLGLVQQYAADGLDLSDPTEGRDIMVPVSKPGNGMRYGNFAIAPRSSKAEFDQDALHDLAALAEQRILTPDEVQEALPNALGEFADMILGLYEKAQAGDSATDSSSGSGSAPDLKDMSVKDLHEMAKELGLTGYTKLTKAKLILEIKRALG